MPTLQQAKERLDSIINKGRVDLYKPIQIAEVLRRSRLNGDIVITEISTYQTPLYVGVIAYQGNYLVKNRHHPHDSNMMSGVIPPCPPIF
jgi:hypothetical protein